MANTRTRNSTEKVKPSVKSSSPSERSKTAEQTKQVRIKMAAARNKMLCCVDCGKQFDSLRMLQQHKRSSCRKSSVRFTCQECRAFFLSRVELHGHISAAHQANSSESAQQTNSPKKKSQDNSAPVSGAESIVSLMKGFKDAHGAKWKKVLKQKMSSDDLKKLKSVLASKAAKQDGKFSERLKNIKESLKEAVVEARTVGKNPFTFTTSCAPDAESYQFLCQSCLTVRYATYAELREHEDWCARVRSSPGVLCLPCGRYYRTLGTLRRHAEEYHNSVPVQSEAKKIVGNLFQFSTTVALDATSHPHVCASCQVVCFAKSTILRKHEDWCGQCISAKDGWKCNRCGRCFRTSALLEQHTAADDCLKTETVTATVDDLKKIDRDTESESTDGRPNVKQKLAPGTSVHSVCPLCDMPFISQYEQQVHFMNVHSLTSAELKIKHPTSRRGFVEKQVTCLDCDLVFSTRLELVQHKRECAKDKKFTKILLPVKPWGPCSKNKKSTNEVDNSTKKEDRPKKCLKTMSSSATRPRTKKCRSRSEHAAVSSKSEKSSGLLLNKAKVRSLIKKTGAKQFLLKPDGKLVILGDGDRKISATESKPIISQISGDSHLKSHFSSINDSSKPCSSEKPNAITSPDVGSDQSIEELKTDKHASSKNQRGNCKLVETSEKDSVQSGDHLESSSCKVSRIDEEVLITDDEVNHCDEEQHPSKVDGQKSSEVENASAAAPKAYQGKRKFSRKRPLQSRVTDIVDLTDIVDSGPKKSATSALELKNSATTKELVLLSTRAQTLLDNECSLSVKMADLPAPAPSSEVGVQFELLSEVNDGQQSLLGAQELVPISNKLDQPDTITSRRRTRSQRTNANISEGPPSKKCRHLDNVRDNATSKSTKDNGHALELTKTVSKTNKFESIERMRVPSNMSVSQKTWTIEPLGDSLVRCAECRTVFETVRQIVDHICSPR